MKHTKTPYQQGFIDGANSTAIQIEETGGNILHEKCREKYRTIKTSHDNLLEAAKHLIEDCEFLQKEKTVIHKCWFHLEKLKQAIYKAESND